MQTEIKHLRIARMPLDEKHIYMAGKLTPRMHLLTSPGQNADIPGSGLAISKYPCAKNTGR